MQVARAESKRITDLETLQREVVGRPMANINDSERFTIEPGGRLSGFIDNAKVRGKWEFRDGYFCRSFRVDIRFIEDGCNVISFDENGITMIRAEGQGTRVKYRFTD